MEARRLLVEETIRVWKAQASAIASSLGNLPPSLPFFLSSMSSRRRIREMNNGGGERLLATVLLAIDILPCSG